MQTRLEFTAAGQVGTLHLVPPAPDKPPTFDHPTLDAVDRMLDGIESAIAAGTVRLLFIRSGSPKFFCAGANLGALREIDAGTIAAWVEHGHRVFARLEDLPVPVVARVEGYALGGGLELALACDLIFASDGAQLGQTEAHLGFVAGWGGSWRLPRRIGVARAKELFYTARRVSGPEALALGLVDACVPAAELEARCVAFAAAVLAGSAGSHREHKVLLRNAGPPSLPEAASAEAAASMRCLENGDTQARLQAFFARRSGPAAPLGSP